MVNFWAGFASFAGADRLPQSGWASDKLAANNFRHTDFLRMAVRPDDGVHNPGRRVAVGAG
jgi:hypothetical protein